MTQRAAILLSALVAITACGDPSPEMSPRTEIPAEEIVSGFTFLQPETQALQTDSFSNPAYLWVDQGEALFHEGAKACSSCHETGGLALKGAAAKYPALDAATEELFNLEARINACRTTHQNKPALAYESDDLLSLTAYVANLSAGMPHAPELTEETQKFYEIGETYFFTRRGQFNMSCAACHNETWGKKLRGDTISQGHPNGFPAYRLEWQALGSLHRRLRDCDTGVRAEPLDFGDPTYTAVEYYLALRSGGLPIETPAIRR